MKASHQETSPRHRKCLVELLKCDWVTRNLKEVCNGKAEPATHRVLCSVADEQSQRPLNSASSAPGLQGAVTRRKAMVWLLIL